MNDIFLVTDTVGGRWAFTNRKDAKRFMKDNYDPEWPHEYDIEKVEVVYDYAG